MRVLVAMLRSETDGPSIYGVYVNAVEANHRLLTAGWVRNPRRRGADARQVVYERRGGADPYGAQEYLVLGRFEVQGPIIEQSPFDLPPDV